MTLKTRPPTCIVPFPLVLIEGPADSGKTRMLVTFTADPRIGRSLMLDLGDGNGDEYGDAATSGTATYEIVEHDGSWASIIGQLEAAHTEAAQALAAGEKPWLLGVDSGTNLWEMLKTWGGARAKGSVKNQRLLAFDPNADIRIPNNIWDDVHARHQRLMELLTTFPGIVVVTCRGRETYLAEDPADPVPKVKTYKVECHRDLTHEATAWIRLSLDAPPTIIGAKSKFLAIQYGKDEARVVPDLDLAAFVFNTLRVSADSQPRPRIRLGRERLPEHIRDEAIATGNRDRLQQLLAEAAHPAHQGVTVDNEWGEEESLTELIARRIRGLASRPGSTETTATRPAALPRPADDKPPTASAAPSGKVTDQMAQTLAQMLAKCGKANPDQRLTVLQILTGARLTSERELAAEAAATVMGLLAPALAAPSPGDKLAEIMQHRMADLMAAQFPTIEEKPAA
ncbi:hypothetical protein ACIBEJ_00290 [Nonomuraea sp. NPDC050790]|uniref:hypothetical protein n=1 Tax=Nonomuraea sp. NPDC050790 TaxID=3364371 RepID=UPI00379FC73E